MGKIKNSKEYQLVEFIFEQQQRLGCLMRFSNVPRLAAQSVSEHSYSVAFLAMLVGDYLADKGGKVDRLRLLKMALIHDVEEVISGDILKTLKHGKFKEELGKLNEQNMYYLTRLLGGKKEEYLDFWREVKDGVTLEAKLISFVDMVDRIVYCLKESHLGNNYFRELLEFEAKKLMDWIPELPELDEFIVTLSAYALEYLEGDDEMYKKISRAVRIYDYKIGG